MPGWIDSLAAAGSLTVLVGIGVLKNFNADERTRGDIIPVDMSVNGIIACTAY